MQPASRPIILALCALAAAWLPAAASAEKLATLERGQWYCEMPGDASGPAGLELKQENFRILSASRYKTSEGSGIYLRQGKHVLMTSGPRKGDRYQLVAERIVQKLDSNGNLTPLRCVQHNSDQRL
ncbi:elongation factor P [Altererythrobacter indicus]|uniref:Elongation factor P n=1 Tax=Altericroceibacterium indicum TaxID=374177 RepID=A0A845A6U2_9SPHN|nr:elongation factor P [Altericroceibacterium indicum]MXP25384.1 elongation factor P [Altericroceibacterium indicum]